jgi:hypothetical protein
MDPVADPLLLRESGSVWNRTRASGSVARSSDHRHEGEGQQEFAGFVETLLSMSPHKYYWKAYGIACVSPSICSLPMLSTS